MNEPQGLTEEDMELIDNASVDVLGSCGPLEGHDAAYEMCHICKLGSLMSDGIVSEREYDFRCDWYYNRYTRENVFKP